MAKKELSTSERNRVVQFILEGCTNGKPKRGRIAEACAKFDLCRMTISRLWKAALKQQQKGEVIHILSGKKTLHREPKKVLDLNLLVSLKMSKRGSMRDLASALGVSKSTVGRWVGEGQIKAHSSAIKPCLTTENKLLRIRFSLESLELDRVLNHIKFKDMHNTIHIDEKWFYLTEGNRKVYLGPEEPQPHRTCKSKGFITKVMFMCAVSRPLFASDGECLFDGKIGIFPFIYEYEAKRKSKHRDAGTIEIRALDSITKLVVKDCLIKEIIPAIMNKWPEGASKDIFIQQDNAKPHIRDNDLDFRAAASQQGFNIHLVQQPPNSPDLNVNDLGWFRAIQSLQHQTHCTTTVQLLAAVNDSYQKLTPITLNNIFLSLQGCMVEIMKLKGQNSYKLPHMGKEALRRADMLPLNLEISVELALECLNYLMEMGKIDGLSEIAASLGLDITIGQ